MYTLNYDPFTGKVCSIQNGNTSFGLNEGNADFREFLAWNSKQSKPLNLESTIEVVKPEPVVDLAKEIEGIKGRLEILESTDVPSK